jgi:hypothetical protein
MKSFLFVCIAASLPFLASAQPREIAPAEDDPMHTCYNLKRIAEAAAAMRARDYPFETAKSKALSYADKPNEDTRSIAPFVVSMVYARQEMSAAQVTKAIYNKCALAIERNAP